MPDTLHTPGLVVAAPARPALGAAVAFATVPPGPGVAVIDRLPGHYKHSPWLHSRSPLLIQNTVLTYEEIYGEIIPPLVIDLDTVEEDQRFSAPTLKPFQGWKQLKRKGRGDRAGKQTPGQGCGWCGKQSHNIQSCVAPDKPNKQQRNM